MGIFPRVINDKKRYIIIQEKITYNNTRLVNDSYFCKEKETCSICGSHSPKIVIIAVNPKNKNQVFTNRAVCYNQDCIDKAIDEAEKSIDKNTKK